MRLKARIAGWCYLSVIAGGLFAEVAVRSTVIVPGDVAATAGNIAAHETLWRWGLLVNLLYLLPGLAVNVLIPDLFRPAQATLARLAVACGTAAVAVEALNLLQLYTPLVTTPTAAPLLFAPGFALSLAIFAGFCGLTGVLILRSALVPRLLGALMILAGASYLINSATLFVWPALQSDLMPAILLPCLVGELSLALYFVIRGVREPGQ
jgi:hypothetical protein